MHFYGIKTYVCTVCTVYDDTKGTMYIYGLILAPSQYFKPLALYCIQAPWPLLQAHGHCYKLLALYCIQAPWPLLQAPDHYYKPTVLLLHISPSHPTATQLRPSPSHPTSGAPPSLHCTHCPRIFHHQAHLDAHQAAHRTSSMVRTRSGSGLLAPLSHDCHMDSGPGTGE